MTPGRELDALIAERVIGFKKENIEWPGLFGSSSWEEIVWRDTKNSLVPYEDLPQYSTDISAAWEVVEKCNTVGLLYHDAYVQWQCVLDTQRSTFYDCRISVFADTAPHAICLAALEAIGDKV